LSREAFYPGALCPGFLTAEELVHSADGALFDRVLYNPHHVLHQLLPQRYTNGHNLRHRTHTDSLTSKSGTSQRQ